MGAGVGGHGAALHICTPLRSLVPYEGLINPEGSTDDAEEEASRGRWKQEDRDGYWKMMQKYI